MFKPVTTNCISRPEIVGLRGLPFFYVGFPPRSSLVRGPIAFKAPSSVSAFVIPPRNAPHYFQEVMTWKRVSLLISLPSCPTRKSFFFLISPSSRRATRHPSHNLGEARIMERSDVRRTPPSDFYVYFFLRNQVPMCPLRNSFPIPSAHLL